MVYVIGAGDEFIKIGVARHPEKRVRELQTGNPHKLVLMKTIKTSGRAFDGTLEGVFHYRFRRARTSAQNEWFYVKGTEDLVYAGLNDIKSIASREGLDARNILSVQSYSTELEDNLKPYLDTKTFIALKKNGICSFSELAYFLNGNFYGDGIGEARLQRIKWACNKYMEENRISTNTDFRGATTTRLRSGLIEDHAFGVPEMVEAMGPKEYMRRTKQC